MHLLRATTLWLLVVGICANNSVLDELVTRIHQDIDSAVVYFIGLGDGYSKAISKICINIPVAVFTCFPSELNKLEYFDKDIILVAQVDIEFNENRQYIEMIEKFIQRLRDRKFVIIISSSLQLLEEYFLYFKDNKFTRIFGIAERTPFVYLPYADSPIQELSNQQPLPYAFRDLNGYSIRTTIQTDIPRAFWYSDKNGQLTLGGYMAQLFFSFLQKHNATYSEVVINNSSNLFIPGVLEAITNDDVDISLNTYSPVEGFDMSYPMMLLQWTIMVPLNGYVDPNQYFLRPFTATAWILIGLTLVYIIVMDALKDFYTNMPVSLWLYFRRTFLKFLSMSSEKQITNAYRFHSQVLLFAFILANLYSIHLTSFLTVFINVKQFDTIQELIDNNVPVMMVDYEWEVIADPELHTTGLENILVLVDSDTYLKERDSMANTSYAYPAGMDKAEFLLGLQMNFAKPLFRKISDSLQDFFLVFVLGKHSPFREILDRCIIEIMESGLMEKWRRDAIMQGYQAGLVEVVHSSDRVMNPLTLDHLRFAWTCLVIGLTLAMGAFVGETYGRVLQRFSFRKCRHLYCNK